MGTREQKAAIRTEVLARRKAMQPSEISEKSESIRRRINFLDAFHGARTVMLYVPIRNEVDTTGLIADCHSLGKTVLLPRTRRLLHELAPVVFSAGDALVKGEFGIPEPPLTNPVLPVGEIDLVLLPGVAFSRDGRRLGYGGGFYDRFTRRPDYRAISLGLAFEIQVVPWIPLGRQDRPVDLVVTESRVIIPKRRHF
jgi:5-formyltetrahydrofolate cyclo-ligase